MTGEPTLATFLRSRRDDVVALFVKEVERSGLSPSGTTRSRLVDHIPQFLDEMNEGLASLGRVGSGDDATGRSATAREHGKQRWHLGYDVEALVREYGLLRHCVLVIVKEGGICPSVDEFDVLSKCLTVGISEAVSEYAQYRSVQSETQKANLEFLAETSRLLGLSLHSESTLARLTALVVPRFADQFVVSLNEAEYRDVTSSSFATAPTTDEVHLRLVRESKPRSWMIVPLRVKDHHVLGVLLFGYADSGREYQEADLLLATALANRAAAAIDNARLFELSQEARSRVEAATRAKDEFVAMVSHELRTPLNAILGWLHLMRTSSFDETRAAHALEVIERNAMAQSRLVGDLLDISRIITGSIRIVPAQVELGTIVEMVIEGMRPAADAKRITIHTDLYRDDTMVRGDGERLQQVIWNLLSNAIKFTAKDGSVWVRLRRVDSDLEVKVRDDGEGISREALPLIFENFRQADSSSSRAHGGLGIGLSIAKHLVELHGGTISAVSEGRGAGATLTVLLPISPVVSATIGVTRAPLTTPAPRTSLPTGLNDISVLVVDDERDARELVTFVFESCGMVVRAASNVGEAMDVLATFTPDVIVSDIGMPGDDGYALIRRIRTLADNEKKAIPAIALTAFASHADHARALVEGFSLHLAKPVEPASLVKAVVELSDGHQRQRRSDS